MNKLTKLIAAILGEPTEIIYFTIKNNFDFDYNNHGWGNGYVALPPSHKYFGVQYENIDGIEVHGGLTFSDYATSLRNIPIDKRLLSKYWVVGFDTAHYMDTKENWPEVSVIHETKKLFNQLKNVK